MEKFYALIKLGRNGIEKIWHYKLEEKARAKFDKELEKLKKQLGDEGWTVTKNKATHESDNTLELFTSQFKD